MLGVDLSILRLAGKPSGPPYSPEKEILTRDASTILTRDGSTIIARTA